MQLILLDALDSNVVGGMPSNWAAGLAGEAPGDTCRQAAARTPNPPTPRGDGAPLGSPGGRGAKGRWKSMAAGREPLDAKKRRKQESNRAAQQRFRARKVELEEAQKRRREELRKQLHKLQMQSAVLRNENEVLRVLLELPNVGQKSKGPGLHTPEVTA
ncbi:unnamed protein product [Ostreobium quekettii]|uniref:BZIP domain-containing protein n=1 Tax=Ostreobium quekettii TaxID=121088 RepID=A0A8S1IX59_9CHLO|nr:unnamed protein product [Ostreobium quekettii]|eukprot:evm.model.scf_3.3 EVM.evm.TU.scf_3.3   scf_3:58200-60986(+)